jgi:hypothetical protein
MIGLIITSIKLSIYSSTALVDLVSFFSFLIFIHSRQGSLNGGSARPKAATYTHDNTNTEIHASSGIQTHDSSVREGGDGSCLTLRDHCDRPPSKLQMSIVS